LERKFDGIFNTREDKGIRVISWKRIFICFWVENISFFPYPFSLYVEKNFFSFSLLSPSPSSLLHHQSSHVFPPFPHDKILPLISHDNLNMWRLGLLEISSFSLMKLIHLFLSLTSFLPSCLSDEPSLDVSNFVSKKQLWLWI
jgi:hypothetical protein